MASDPALYPIENRGYGRGTGSVLLPNGTQVQVSDETPELNNVLLHAAYWQEWIPLMEAMA